MLLRETLVCRRLARSRAHQGCVVEAYASFVADAGADSRSRAARFDSAGAGRRSRRLPSRSETEIARWVQALQEIEHPLFHTIK